MVIQHHIACRIVELGGMIQEEARADGDVLLHQLVFLGGELSTLLQQRVADADLAHVVQLGGDAQAIALTLERRALQTTPTRPFLEDGCGDSGHALDVLPSLDGIARLHHAQHAHDDAVDQLRALDRHRGHACEVGEQRLVGFPEALARQSALIDRVEQLQHAHAATLAGAQRHRQHASRAIAGESVEGGIESEGGRRFDRVRVLHVHRLSARAHPSRDRVVTDRDGQAAEARRLGRLARQRVVLRVGEAQHLALAQIHRACIGVDEPARIAEDAIHQHVEVLHLVQLQAHLHHAIHACALGAVVGLQIAAHAVDQVSRVLQIAVAFAQAFAGALQIRLGLHASGRGGGESPQRAHARTQFFRVGAAMRDVLHTGGERRGAQQWIGSGCQRQHRRGAGLGLRLQRTQQVEWLAGAPRDVHRDHGRCQARDAQEGLRIAGQVTHLEVGRIAGGAHEIGGPRFVRYDHGHQPIPSWRGHLRRFRHRSPFI